MDGALTGVQPVNRGWGVADIAKFVIVIIFDDPGAATARKFDEGRAALERKRCPQGIVTRRRCKNQARRRVFCKGLFDAEALVIDLDRTQRSAIGPKYRTGADITGFFEPDRIAGVEQHAADQIKTLLRTRGDNDLLRSAGHTAEDVEMPRNSPPQGLVAGIGCIGENLTAKPPRRLV